MSEVKKKQSVHSGHRERMNKKYKKLGADAFEPHELLEMLLYFSIRQRNTNETAHSFIDEFGSVSAAYSAKVDAMMKVKGIGEVSSRLISLSRDVARIATLEHCEKAPFDNSFRISRFIYTWFCGKPAGTVMAIYLDEDKMLLECEALSGGRMFRPASYPPIILEKAQELSAKYVIISHSHKDNCPDPSPDDLWLCSHIRSALGKNGIMLIDQYIVTEFDCIPTSDYK